MIRLLSYSRCESSSNSHSIASRRFSFCEQIVSDACHQASHWIFYLPETVFRAKSVIRKTRTICICSAWTFAPARDHAITVFTKQAHDFIYCCYPICIIPWLRQDVQFPNRRLDPMIDVRMFFVLTFVVGCVLPIKTLIDLAVVETRVSFGSASLMNLRMRPRTYCQQ